MQEWQLEKTSPRITSARLAFCQPPVKSAGRVSWDGVLASRLFRPCNSLGSCMIGRHTRSRWVKLPWPVAQVQRRASSPSASAACQTGWVERNALQKMGRSVCQPTLDIYILFVSVSAEARRHQLAPKYSLIFSLKDTPAYPLSRSARTIRWQDSTR